MAIWKIAFVSENLKADQSQLTKCSALVAASAIPANSTARATMQVVQNI